MKKLNKIRSYGLYESENYIDVYITGKIETVSRIIGYSVYGIILIKDTNKNG